MKKFTSVFAIALCASLLFACQPIGSAVETTLNTMGDPEAFIEDSIIEPITTATLPEDLDLHVTPTPNVTPETADVFSVSAWNGVDAYTVVNAGIPYFLEEDELIHWDEETSSWYTTCDTEYYSELDDLGRCGVTYGLVSRNTMPTDPRGDIGSVHPTGWHTVRYDDLISDHYLYNRCHLIGYQLTGENANVCNLITGTRYLNIDGMLPFENEIADYFDSMGHADNHVLYRVTPIFDGDDLVAQGVLMEAFSVEDNGEGVQFCVFAYNVQPGITIDYTTGDSYADSTVIPVTEETEDIHSPENAVYDEFIPAADTTYVLNTSSGRFHSPDCSVLSEMNPANREEVTCSREELIEQGYTPCRRCNP